MDLFSLVPNSDLFYAIKWYGRAVKTGHAFLPWPGLWVLLMCPLVGSAICSLGVGRGGWVAKYSGWVATIASAISFFLTVHFFVLLSCIPLLDPARVNAVFSNDPNIVGPVLKQTLWQWFSVDLISVDFSLRFDRLTSVMCLFVTGVGTLIHLYAIGYMEHDENRPRFFAYMNLFLFSMLVLVLGANLLMLFIGWEGVGLCSYLLIGFWYKNMDNAKAGQKAFVYNRVGDAGFLLGIFLLAYLAHSLDFDAINSLVSAESAKYQLFGFGVLSVATFCLFVGATGKSAQIPLYVWLPDAMAGPTPVSALIHAATMVTAGVYMVVRLGPIFLASPLLPFIALIGAMTAFLGATIALVQYDIKKVLAYSTISQLGFMFMAVGVGALSVGLFHVVTHAFFKACLFMGAGSVILGCHHEQDMRRFGGLRKFMPITFATYLVASLTISGFPMFSGAVSKDAILYTVLQAPDSMLTRTKIFGFQLNELIWALGILTAFLTAFYMTRSLMMTFFGNYRGHVETQGHHEHQSEPKESSGIITVPLMVLAILSATFGYLYDDHFMYYLAPWTRDDIMPTFIKHAEHLEPFAHVLNHVCAMCAALGGIMYSVWIYGFAPHVAREISNLFPTLYRLMVGKWWVDELYARFVIRPLTLVSELLFRFVDRIFIDGLVNGSALFVEANGELVSRLHNGRIGSYALMMLSGMLFFLLFWFLG